MKMNFKYTDVIWLIYITALVNLFVDQLISHYEVSSWAISEFLINYQGGFVRRGLIGEVLFWTASSIPAIDIVSLIKIVCAASFIILFALLFHWFIKHGVGLFALPMTFILGFPIVNDFWIRKDSLLLLLLALSLKLMRSNKTSAAILSSVVSCIALLTHESFLFIFIFPFILYIINQYKLNNIFNIFFLVISFFATLTVVTIFSGSNYQANSIIESWKTLGIYSEPTEYTVQNSVYSLSWGLIYALDFTKSTMTSIKNYIPLFLPWMVIILFTFILILNIHKSPQLFFHNNNKIKSKKNNFMMVVVIFQFVFLIPLFFIGIDYGRWIYLWTTSSLLIFFSSLNDRSFTKIDCVKKISALVNEFLDKILNISPHVYATLCLLLGFSAYGWVGEKIFTTTPLYITISFVLRTYQNIMMLF